MNRFNSLQKIIDAYLWNPTEHIVQSLGKIQDFSLWNWKVTSRTHCHLLKFKLYGIILYEINFFRIVLLNCKPSFWNWYFHSKKLCGIFLTLSTSGYSERDRCLSGGLRFNLTKCSYPICLSEKPLQENAWINPRHCL